MEVNPERKRGKIHFGIVGSGWRSEFYLRVAQALPERFAVGGLVSRSEARRTQAARKWGVPVFATLDGMLRSAAPGFVVLSVPRSAAPELIVQCVAQGVPVLTETPPAAGLAEMLQLHGAVAARRDARVQVAEQYHLQPALSAAIALARSGRLGEVSQAQLSWCHGYHGVSILRRLLGVGFGSAHIRARRFVSPLTQGPGRDGGPAEEKTARSEQMVAQLDFDGKLGVYDFTDDQYFSWIRGKRLLVRGERGELLDGCARWLKDYRTPVEAALRRVNAGENGNLEGYYLKGILLGDEWIYRNPFVPARLADDELAVASCLEKMDAFARGGPSFYSLAEAMQDHYLSLAMDRAADTGETVETETQPWAEQ